MPTRTPDKSGKTEVLFTRCDEELRSRATRYAARLARKLARPVSLAMATRHALEREFSRSEKEES